MNINIKNKIKSVLPIIIIILLILIYKNFSDGLKYKSQLPQISIADKVMMGELSEINTYSKIEIIDNNIKNFILLVKEILLNVDIVNNEGEIISGIDKVGEFRDLIIRGDGDYFNQVYLLKEMNDKTRSFVLIKSIEANKKQIILKVRVYGRTR